MILLNNKIYACPVDLALDLFNGKWKILILSQLYHFEKMGFSELRNNLQGVSEKMLSQQLKELGRDDLISKTILSEKPLRVEYFLSERGISFIPLIDFLSKWGMKYLKENNIEYKKDRVLTN